MPPTVVGPTVGTIVSPWPPRTYAWTTSTETFNSSAKKLLYLAVSKTPAIPTTFSLLKPLTFRACCAIASRGLVTIIKILFGDFEVVCSTTSETIFIFVSNKSSRLMPGFLAIPDVITIMSELAVSSYELVPIMCASEPTTGPDSRISKALP